MDDGIAFKIKEKNGITIFENHSDYILYISVKPIKPKRKYETIAVVQPGSFIINDVLKLDLTSLSFTLEKV